MLNKDKAPLTSEQRKMLKAYASDLKATAKEKGITLSDADFRIEKEVAEKHFELGCWLFWYKNNGLFSSGLHGFQLRVACFKMLEENYLGSPEYDFFTVFGFGERDYDSLLEMGDGDKVRLAAI
jgi:hypothetical protein